MWISSNPFSGTSWYSCCIALPGVWFPASNWEPSWEYGAWMWESMAYLSYFAYCWRNQLIVEDIVSDHIKIYQDHQIFKWTDQPLGPVDPSAAGKRQDLFAGQHVTRGYQAAICKTCFNSFQNISRIWLRMCHSPKQGDISDLSNPIFRRFFDMNDVSPRPHQKKLMRFLLLLSELLHNVSDMIQYKRFLLLLSELLHNVSDMIQYKIVSACSGFHIWQLT